MSIAAVILAAGFSRRLGRPKQTVMLNGETLVERSVRIGQHAGLSPIIVVINAEATFGEILRQLGCTVVVNEVAAEGMASSIRVGIRTAERQLSTGAILMTCDQIGLSPEHLRSLMDSPLCITGSSYAGRIGIPAYFPASSFNGLLALHGDVGARDLLRNAHAITAEDLSLDIDTEADVASAQKRV